ncbi:hypothetical protein [Thalassolituus hydrocarboniclasticus]|uniref:Uncharacterized protein n=1 Tax=Thalassolituus hydrocarboniclasticus TaxID=2742796 RepID=A0ABY6A9Y4_9GAMM|nr:hypothetical protein [Thalassolituus hydrocarboniclasticus]UXD87658.1 hypothetical protein HUF19_09550 [Thalassolituus hydrocarboniclasticus]
MSEYEILSLLISILAVVVSAVSLVRTRKIAKEQLELEKVTAELSRLQIDSLNEEKSNKDKPSFNVTLTKLGKSYNFYISNTGQGSAYNVNFELVDCEDSPLCNDVEDKFPLPEMKPNSRVKLIAAIHMGSPLKYQVRLSWQNKEGENFNESHWITM